MSLLQIAMAYAALWAGCTALALGLEAVLGRARRIWSLPVGEGQRRWELWSSLRFLLLCTGATALAAESGALRFSAQGAAAFAGTWFFTWVCFEIYYYALHRALHTRPLFRFHRHHHRSHVTTAFSGFSLGIVESVGWIVGMLAPPILLGSVAPVSFAGWAFYVLCNFYVNIAGHINAETMPAAAGTRLASWGTHPLTYHALHHARFRNHYAFASSFMDRLLGTEWSDWPRLHERVVAGEPLDRLSVQG